MATDLDVTTAEFGTNSLVGATNEYLPSNVQAQMSYNTGFNKHRPYAVHTWRGTVATDTSTTEYAKSLMLAGTYNIYTTINVSSINRGTVTLNGTAILISGTASAWIEGSATDVIIATTGWITITYNYVPFTVGTTAYLYDGAVFARMK